jgi:DNA-binding MarR family transcriptional regulator
MKIGSEAIFLQEKPAKCLLLLKKSDEPTYASIIAREIDTTYAHTLKVLSRLRRSGFIYHRPAGRIKLVDLTDLGEETAACLETFIDMARLSELGARVERVYERKIKGRSLDKKAISKRLKPHGRELRRMARRNPEIRGQAKKLAKRIREIIKEGAKPAQKPSKG